MAMLYICISIFYAWAMTTPYPKHVKGWSEAVLRIWCYALSLNALWIVLWGL